MGFESGNSVIVGLLVAHNPLLNISSSVHKRYAFTLLAEIKASLLISLLILSEFFIFDRSIRESLENDKEEFINYINNLFNDANHTPVGKCPECGLMLTDEDELEDGTHEYPKCGSILEDNDFWEIED